VRERQYRLNRPNRHDRDDDHADVACRSALIANRPMFLPLWWGAFSV
jgi:hypothetical protein